MGAAAQAGRAEPAAPGASGWRGSVPRTGAVGRAAAWVRLAHSHQPTRGVLSLGSPPSQEPLGREVVGSPNPYDLLSQPPLRPTCQRSQVRPGPGAEER